MPVPAPLDPTDYVMAPRLSVPAAVALGIALLSAVPEPPPEGVLLAAGRLREAVVVLQQQWGLKAAAERVVSTVPRDVDNRVDRCFRAMSMRLEALTLLRAEAGPEIAMATAARGRLFPDGLRFLTLPFEQQWAHGQQIIDQLDGDAALAADVEQLVGPMILGELRAAQQAYGEVLGITAPQPSVESISLAEPLEALRRAIVGYALHVVAMQDIDQARIADAHQALAPIDRLRALQARRAGGGPAEGPAGDTEDPDDTVSPQSPVPTIDGASVEPG